MSRSSSMPNGIFNSTGVITGTILALIFVFVRIFSESQYETIYRLDPSGIIPPLWLLNLISFVWFFLIGYGMGIVLDSVLYKKRNCSEQVQIYKGLVVFTACFFLSNISYSVFFRGKHIFIAMLMLLTAIACSAVDIIVWSKIKKVSALIMGGYSIWLFYLFIIYFSVLLHL